MIYESSWQAIAIFFLFVGFTLGFSFWLGRKAKSSEGYFAAHGQIPQDFLLLVRAPDDFLEGDDELLLVVDQSTQGG